MIPPPSSNALQTNILCANCNYNLRGLTPASRCPECGKEVTFTLHVANYFPVPARLAVAKGMTLLAISILMPIGTLALCFLASLTNAYQPVLAAFFLGFIVEHITRLIATLKMTDPSQVPFTASRAAAPLRLFAALEVASFFVFLIFTLFHLESPISQSAAISFGILFIVYCISRSFGALHLGRYMEDITATIGHPQKLALTLGAILCVSGCLTGASWILLVVMDSPHHSMSSMDQIVGTTAILSLFLVLALYVALAILLFVHARRLRRSTRPAGDP